jgi:hypothetical protein
MLSNHWKSHWGEWDALFVVLIVACVVVGLTVKKLMNDA